MSLVPVEQSLVSVEPTPKQEPHAKKPTVLDEGTLVSCVGRPVVLDFTEQIKVSKNFQHHTNIDISIVTDSEDCSE